MTFYDVTKLFWAFWAVGNLSFQNVKSQLLSETLGTFFTFQLPLNSSFKNVIKKLGDLQV